MQFLPTVTLDAPTQEAILAGNLKLQTGQWVSVNPGDKPSRFIRVSGNSIWAIHPEGLGAERRIRTARFRFISATWLGDIARAATLRTAAGY